jgi:hypothetical protein
MSDEPEKAPHQQEGSDPPLSTSTPPEEQVAAEDETQVGQQLADRLDQALTLDSDAATATNEAEEATLETVAVSPSLTILCDLGYGIPKEGRPRKEKLLAIAKQLVNFLLWQQNSALAGSTTTTAAARLILVSCPDEVVQDALRTRMHALWTAEALPTAFPDHILSFSSDSLEDWCARYSTATTATAPTSRVPPTAATTTTTTPADIVYLSPDAPAVLDAKAPPPSVVVVGLLIDRRRIQVNRSLDRAATLHMTAARWPLEQVVANVSATEPLNVDTVLEGMQQWHWNYSHAPGKPFVACADAMVQALEHHAARHPARPVHKVVG